MAAAQSKKAKASPRQLTPFGTALAGALGACFSNAVVYPLDVAKTRIQATSPTALGKRKDGMTMSSVLRDILRHEGVKGWYSGFAATMLNTFSMQYAYFFFYTLLRSTYVKRLASRLPAGSKSPPLSTAAELSLGAIAGALSQIFTIPVSVIATRQQIGSRSGGDRTSDPVMDDRTNLSYSLAASDMDSDSFIDVAREIIREDGVTGLWRGLKPSMVLTINPAITYGVYERLKHLMLVARSDVLNPWMSFLLGAFSKSLATIITYPYIMAKVRIQARASADLVVEVNEAVMTEADDDDDDDGPSDVEKLKGSLDQRQCGGRDSKVKHAGALGLLVRVLKREGLVGWYQGMSAQIIKAMLSQALLFVSKEQFERWALVMMIAFSKLRSP